MTDEHLRTDNGAVIVKLQADLDKANAEIARLLKHRENRMNRIEALMKAAQAWGADKTSKYEMNADLAEAFADILQAELASQEPVYLVVNPFESAGWFEVSKEEYYKNNTNYTSKKILYTSPQAQSDLQDATLEMAAKICDKNYQAWKKETYADVGSASTGALVCARDIRKAMKAQGE
jgi:hypothetical protein